MAFSLFGITGEPPKKKVSPTKEAGSSGFAVYGGYLQSKERNPKLTGQARYETWSGMLANISIIAACSRAWTDMLSRPEWSVQPALDIDGEESSDEAKQAAEFIERNIDGLETGWARQVRRASTYALYGFYAGEWTMQRAEDGALVVRDIDNRPQHTIERWIPDERGNITGVWQRNPQDGVELWLPREKLVYVVDDALSDSPEGLGMLRQTTEAAQRLKEYLRLEGLGYSRDMRGLPLARIPYAAINKAVSDGEMTEEQAAAMVKGVEDFIQFKSKDPETSLALDSSTYKDATAQGDVKNSGALQWDFEIIKGGSSGLDEIGAAIEREKQDIARTFGMEAMLLGGAGGSGNRSLGQDKSRNLYARADSALRDIQECFNRDFVGPICKYNSIPRELRPSLSVESVQPKDIELLGSTIRDLSTAGVVLDRDDEPVKEMFQMMGLSEPESDAMMAGMLQAEAEEGA